MLTALKPCSFYFTQKRNFILDNQVRSLLAKLRSGQKKNHEEFRKKQKIMRYQKEEKDKPRFFIIKEKECQYRQAVTWLVTTQLCFILLSLSAANLKKKKRRIKIKTKKNQSLTFIKQRDKNLKRSQTKDLKQHQQSE